MLESDNSSDESGSHVVLTEVDVDEVVEKIVDDIRIVKLDTNRKVDQCKTRIKRILSFYKRKSVDEFSTTEDNDNADVESIRKTTSATLKKSMTSLYEKAARDTNVVQLMDRDATSETKRHIRKTVIDDNLQALRYQAKEEARKVNECSQALTLAAKASIRSQLQAKHEDYVHTREELPFLETKLYFEESDAKTKRLVETTKQTVNENLGPLLTNPTGKKTGEEIESERFLTDALAQFRTKLKGDFESQKGVVNKTVDDIKSKVGCLFCPKDENGENGEDEEEKV